MINKTFAAQHIPFLIDKDEEVYVSTQILVEVTDFEKNQLVEIAFDIGKVRHYIKFPKSELEAALKEFKKK